MPVAIGQEIPLLYNPDTGEAVRESETVQDPKTYLIISGIALVFIAIGVIYMRHILATDL